MDKSLDEIIKSKPKSIARRGAGPRRNSARSQILGKPVASPAQRARATAPTDLAKVITQSSEKIIVSNLPPDVNESQIRDLFKSTVGPLKEVNLNYDASGRSKGVATVIFVRKGDAQKALSTYNNRLIDGKRPMRIEVVIDPSKPPPLSARVGPAPAAAKPAATARAGGRRPARRGPRKAERPPKTAADLDAEMEDYTAANAPAAAAPAA